MVPLVSCLGDFVGGETEGVGSCSHLMCVGCIVLG